MKINLNHERIEWLKQNDPETYADVLQTLEELDELRESNPIQFFTPHPKQAEFLGSGDVVKAFLGGNRSGKTTAGVVDDLIQAVDEECLPKHLRPYKQWQPPFSCRVLVPDYKRTLGAVTEALNEWAPRDQLLGGTWDSAYDKKHDVLRFSNGSKFEFMTHQQDLEQMGGVKLHRVHYDEEPPEQHRKECRMRLVDFSGDEVFTMTPLHGMTWMYDDVYERRAEDGFTIVEVDIDDNPHLSESGKRAALDGLSPEELESRKSGRFVHFGGMVLVVKEQHLLDPISPEHLKGQSVIVGIDPGIVRGAVVWVAFDRDDRALVFDELYPQNLDVPSVAELIKEKNSHWGITPDYVIDPSGRNRTMVGTVGDEFAAQGIYAAPGMNGRRAGIMQMRRRLNAAPPALMITRDCTHLLWELKRWRVDEDESSDRPKQDQTGDTFKTAGPDHLCFVAGTLVDTASGQRLIERMALGDLVHTRDGLRRVTSAGLTLSDAEVYELALDDGRTLRGTGNHPVWVEGRGFVAMDTIRYGDYLLSRWNPSSTAESPSAATPTRSSDPTGSTSLPVAAIVGRAWAGFTRRFGRTPTGQFQRGITFTTGTATPSTTTSSTWSVSPPGIIFDHTGRPSGQSASASSQTRLDRWLRRGIARLKGERGTASMGGVSWLNANPSTYSASTAGLSIRACSPSLVSAPTTASRHGGARQAWTTLRRNVLSAVRASGSAATHEPRLARVRVVSVSRTGRAPVYNLAVADTPEFFANGVLVHNCDALRYCLQMHYFGPPEQREKRPSAFTPDYEGPYRPRREEEAVGPMGIYA